MKKLLGIMAVVAVMAMLAAPAMAVTTHALPVNVKLTIDSYVYLDGVPADVLVTLTGGATAWGSTIAAHAVSNVATQVLAGIVQGGGAVGTWAASVLEQPVTPGYGNFQVHVSVSGVPPYTAPMTNVQQAVVTITLTVI